MAISDIELKKEFEHLSKTRSVIKSQIESKQSNVENDIEDIDEIKKYVWKRMSSVNDTMDTIEYGYYLSETQNKGNYVKSKLKNIAALKKAYKNAYFGRIDFNTNDKIDNIYVGITTVAEDNKFYAYDWRSPIASLFYNYGIGKASYEAPEGNIIGYILLKRQYKIKDENIIRCFNNDINIDDDYLQEILASTSTDKMTTIVNTIQAEQNKIIRNEKDKYLITQGIAGSGKTSVGLHRIAYLLYRNKNLNSNNVLIFSPSEVFSNYISDVLPELGEENVLQTTFSSFSEVYLNEFKNLEGFSEFLERVYSKDIEENNISYKLSDEIIADLNKFISNFKNNLRFINSFKLKNILFDKKDMTDLLVNKYSNLPIYERIEKISESICDKLGVSLNKYQNIFRENLINILNNKLNIIEIYNEFLDYINNKKALNYEKIDSNNLYYEDLILILYLKFELFGYPYDRKIMQIVIDEAQDYSKLQYTILKKIFAESSFTILGDVNQTINPYYKYKSLEDLKTIFNKNNKYIELTKSYRSTHEIIEYTNKILNLNNVCAIRKNSDIVVEIKNINNKNIYETITNDIINIQRTKNRKIAIITKNIKEAENIYNKIESKFNNIILLKSSEKEKLKDIMVIPSYMSKGLEFDSVIVLNDSNNKYKESEKNLFYVACTRAQHKLIVYIN